MSESPLPLTLFSEDEDAFRDAVRQFAQAEVKPLVRQMDARAQMDAGLIRKLFELGLMGIHIPESLGGAGGSFTMACIAVEELSRVDGSMGVIVDVQNTLVNNAILRWGRPDQKERYLSRLATEWVGAYALSESTSGSDAFALKLRAEDGGDHYSLKGSKLWITSGAEASVFIVFANINPSLGYKGITAFLVERDTAGFTIGKREDKLGIRASSTTELLFDDCRVPKENVLGEIGKGYKIAIETLNEGRIGIGAQMIGIAGGAYEAALSYSKDRAQFGQPISQFQGVQFQLAQMRIDLEAARLMVYNSSRMKDHGDNFIKEAAMAKYFSSKACEKICSTAIDLFGGNGFTKEYPVEKYWRDSKIGQIYEGTSNMQLQTIAKMELAE